MRQVGWALIATSVILSGAVVLHAEKESTWKKWANPADQESTPVVGVRGLDKSKTSTDPTARDYFAIERLEKIKVTPEELAQFKKEGALP